MGSRESKFGILKRVVDGVVNDLMLGFTLTFVVLVTFTGAVMVFIGVVFPTLGNPVLVLVKLAYFGVGLAVTVYGVLGVLHAFLHHREVSTLQLTTSLTTLLVLLIILYVLLTMLPLVALHIHLPIKTISNSTGVVSP
jgi:glucan phosphoethanolaminetransferase (alkaline phosphatase superfamily)